MRKQATLFQYLYDTLTMQIRTEKIRYGESLPSIRQLCKLYNVGIRTVNDVLKVMAEEGYIKTQVRKHAVVVYKNDEGGDPLKPVERLLARRDSVIDLLKVMGCFFPHIIAAGAMLCDEEGLARLRASARGIEHKTPKLKWRIGTSVIQQLIALHHSNLLTDLYIDMDLYGQVPVIDGFESPFFKMTLHDELGIEYLFALVEKKDYQGVYASMEKMFAQATEYVRGYLDEVAAKFPQFAEIEQIPFRWDARKGRVFSYMEIARQITTKIGRGIYHDNELIPTIAELEKEYSASPTTIGKALSVLNNVGLLETVNGRGSLVTLSRAKNMDFIMKDAAMKRDSDTFLSAFQLVALTCKALALLGFDQLDRQAVSGLQESIEDQTNRILPNSITQVLLERQPYDAIRTIYRELQMLLSWGLFFSFANTDDPHYQYVRDRCRKAVNYISLGEKNAFSDTFQEIYIDIFVTMKEALIGFGADNSGPLARPMADEYLGRRLLVP